MTSVTVLALGNAMVMFYLTQGLGFTWAGVWNYFTRVDGWRSGQAPTVFCAWIQVIGNVKWNSRVWLVGGFLSSVYTCIYAFVLFGELKNATTASSQQISGAVFIYLINAVLNILAFATFACLIAEQYFPTSWFASLRASAWNFVSHLSVANAQCFWIEQGQLTPRSLSMSPDLSRPSAAATNTDRLLFRCNSRVLAAVLFTLFLTFIVAVSFATAFNSITVDRDLAAFLEAKGVSLRHAGHVEAIIAPKS